MSPLNFPTPTPLPNSSPAAPQTASGKAPQGKGFDDAMQQALGDSSRSVASAITPQTPSPAREKKKADAPAETNDANNALLASMMCPEQLAAPPPPVIKAEGEAAEGEAPALTNSSTSAATFALAEDTDSEETSTTATTSGDTEEAAHEQLPATRTGTANSADTDSLLAQGEVEALEPSTAKDAQTTPLTRKKDDPSSKIPSAPSFKSTPEPATGLLQPVSSQDDAKAGAIQLSTDFAAVSSNPELEQAMADAMKKLPPAISDVDADAAKNELSVLADDETLVKTKDGASGIPAAQQVVAMKKNGKSSHNSSQGEQNLPGTGSDASAETTSFHAPRPVRLAGNVEFSTAPHFMPGMEMPKPEMPTVTNLVAVPTQAPSLTQLESTQELVSNHALRLKQSEDGSMQVVIKPAEGLQLSLHLKQVAGTVEVQAQLNQGDADFMSRHWKQLQEQLESRGIRLAPLTTEQNLTNSNNAGSRQEAPAREAQRLMAEDAAPTARRNFGSANASTVSPNQPKPVRTTAWEYWA